MNTEDFINRFSKATNARLKRLEDSIELIEAEQRVINNFHKELSRQLYELQQKLAAAAEE